MSATRRVLGRLASIAAPARAVPVLPQARTAAVTPRFIMSTRNGGATRSFSTSQRWLQEEQKAEEPKQEKKEEEPEAKDMRDEKIAELEKLVQELKGNWKLALADADNIKKIAIRDVDKAREFGIEKLVKSLMNVLDTIDISLQHKPDFESDQHKDNVVAKGAFGSLEAINKQLATIFGTYNMTEIRPQVGDPFDPMMHNALFEVDPPASPPAAPGTIGLVVKNGWKRKDALIRAAAVGVVKQQ